jgi:hypothetical protein
LLTKHPRNRIATTEDEPGDLAGGLLVKAVLDRQRRVAVDGAMQPILSIIGPELLMRIFLLLFS